MSDANRYLLNVDQIQKFLPHRSPFLMVDRVLEIRPNGDLSDLSPANMVGTQVTGLKNLSFNEPFFQGHFPGYAIFPGVLMVEAMAQTASFSIYPYVEKDLVKFTRDFQCILVGVDGARFRKPSVPGDSVKIQTTVTKCRGRLWAFKCEATVDGQKVAEAELMANMVTSFNAGGST
jgi:3-hydroxyacyl-[acyl-carrier-protein] dehydratase